MIGVASGERNTYTHTHKNLPARHSKKKNSFRNQVRRELLFPYPYRHLIIIIPYNQHLRIPPVTTSEGHDKVLIELGSAKRLTPTPMQNRKEKPRLPCGDTSIASSWLAISPSFKAAPLSHLHPHRHCHHYCYHHWNPPPPLPLLLQEQSSSAHSCQTNQTRTDTAVYDKHD